MNKTTIFSMICILIISTSIVGCQKTVECPDCKDDICQIESGLGTYIEAMPDYEKDIKTKNFKTEAELLTFIQDNTGGSNYYLGGGMRATAMVDMEMAEAMDSAQLSAPMKAGGDGSLDFSETNIQVKGVDEADIIKTDGNYIYTISNSVLFIIKAYPGEEAEIVSKIRFDNRPESLFINGDTLAVFGNFHNRDYYKKIDFVPRYGMTYLNIYDIEDREDPELVKEYKFEGNYFRGRMTNDYAYILTSTRPEYRIDHPMPLIIEDDVRTSIAVEDIYYYDIPYQNPLFVNIHAINLADPMEDIESKAVAVEYSQNLYMSEDNIYITYTENINEYDLEKEVIKELLENYLTDDDEELIAKIKSTDNAVLSKNEKEQKIFAVYERAASRLTEDEQEELEDKAEELMEEKLKEHKFFEFTVINKIEVDGDEITPTANGKVPGHIINQFSLDENDDVLRIATTVNPRWSRYDSQRSESTNNIYTLDEDLEIMDELEGLAEDERIFSTRFIGDRLYMVTFKQVDPFFVIDLSNPERIKELGQLKIPGFSRYLHPYDKDTIIGIGQDATESGRAQGLKISLFDVSDVENPKEIAKYITESKHAGSSALYEHKAFLFSREKELLVIPAYNYDYQDKTQNYNGAFVFNIKKDEIKLRGLIDHSKDDERRWSPNVERSLYIEELLYTKSNDLLRINEIEDLSSVKSIDLEYSETEIPVY